MSTLEVRLHVPSLLLGAAVVLLLGLARPAATATAAPQSTRHELASGPGDWRDLVRIEEGFPYQVPEGKVLVVQSAGYKSKVAFNFSPPVAVDVDGEVELFLDPASGPNQVLPGWVVGTGSRVTISMEGDDAIGYVFGYLVSL